MLEFIKQLAVEAGQLAEEGRKRLRDSDIRTKADPADVVTRADREVEEFIVNRIRSRFPGHGFLGEETGESGSSSEYRWVIDPIDGTTSFIHGYPFYSVSIAFQHNGETVAGAVYAPMLNELFSAEAGKGAHLNGHPIHVSSCTELSRALLATGFACVRARRSPDNFDYLPQIARAIQGIRRSGSAALDLCYVAAGRLDGYWEFPLNLYDIAAGALILKEAGGTLTDLAGSNHYPESGIIATNTLLHSKLLAFFLSRPWE